MTKLGALCLAALLAGAGPAFAAAKPIAQDAARPAADTARDAARKPAEMLAFAGIRPGSVVVDMLPGGGYFTRIFAKAVEPNGRVYAYFGDQYDARLKSQGKDPDMQFMDLKRTYHNLGVIHGPLTKFVTPEPVDVVWTSLNYHDLHNTPTQAADIAAINKAVYASLKRGGVYVVVDHRAAKGAGLDASSKLHRMDIDLAKQEIEAAGFTLVAEGKDLANDTDDLTKRVFEAGEHDHTNQFMLKFRKPR